MSKITVSNDAFGREIWDHYRGVPAWEIVERDDGFILPGTGPGLYFLEHKDWEPHEKKAITKVRGRVLDIGCGAGRHSLYLQSKGLEVTAIDNSPLAVKTSRLRGVHHVRLMSFTGISSKLGRFDTVIMFGNNLALVGNPKRAVWFLRRLHSLTSEQGQIVGLTRNPYDTDVKEHLDWHKVNRREGRMSGQGWIRIRYGSCTGPWIDFLFLSPEELARIAKKAGWTISEIIHGQGGQYAAVMDKVK
jgi:2-polyprenyl-3-methyl-5-hydroxy-6-metoxy-1,4-benzoquinol methylase